MSKTLNPSVYDDRFEKFTLPSLGDWMETRDKLLLCPIRAIEKYLSGAEQHCSVCSSLFVLTEMKEGGSEVLFILNYIGNCQHT